MIANITVKICALVLMSLAVLSVFYNQSRIGKSQDDYTSNDYLVNLIGTGLMILVCGRVFGWW